MTIVGHHQNSAISCMDGIGFDKSVNFPSRENFVTHAMDANPAKIYNVEFKLSDRSMQNTSPRVMRIKARCADEAIRAVLAAFPAAEIESVL